MTPDEMKDELRRPTGKTTIPNNRLLSSGATLLNLALSGKRGGAFAMGTYVLLIGDSGGGKTFEALTVFAEACLNGNFDDHRLIYDNVENGALMDLASFFGQDVAKRLEPPRLDDAGKPKFSGTVQEFYFNIYDALDQGPCIYVLDSMDALSSDEADDKFLEVKKAHEEGKEVAGSYGDGKAKANSQNIRTVVNKLEKTDSILIIICQTRDNIGFGAQFNPKTRAGGRALKFYAACEMWVSVRSQLTKKVANKNRQIGILSEIRIKKNRLTGKDRSVTIPIYHSHGMDDTGSMVEWMVEEGYWSKSKNGIVDAGEFGKHTVEKLIQHIEANDEELALQKQVAACWHDLEQSLAVERKRRYD